MPLCRLLASEDEGVEVILLDPRKEIAPRLALTAKRLPETIMYIVLFFPFNINFHQLEQMMVWSSKQSFSKAKAIAWSFRPNIA
jgi:hypothetical protein